MQKSRWPMVTSVGLAAIAPILIALLTKSKTAKPLLLTIGIVEAGLALFSHISNTSSPSRCKL